MNIAARLWGLIWGIPAAARSWVFDVRPYRWENPDSIVLQLVKLSFGTSIFILSLGLIGIMFAPLVPTLRMMLWAIPTAVWLLLWMAVLGINLVRTPGDEELARVWEPVSRIFVIGTVCILVSSIWLFMPYADTKLRLFMVIIMVIHVPNAIMSATLNVDLDRVMTVSILGSMAAVFLIYGGESAWPLAGFMLVYAIIMLVVGGISRGALRDMVIARQNSETLSHALEAALVKLATESDARARFIASASHDLGQPLQAARLFFDQVLRGEGGAKREKAVRGVNWAFDTSESLLRQMIDHLRLEASAVAAEMEDVPLGPLIAQMAEHHEPAARISGVRIVALPSRYSVRADPALIERALANLVGNAIRHAKAKRVLIGARQCAGLVRLWVIDDGCGVAEADIPRLFDDYVQGSDHADEVRGGFGLGLASARRMAELMGGSAGLDTRWTDGSAFFLELSVTEAIAV